MKNRKLKPIVKRTINAIIFMLIGIAIYQLFTIKTINGKEECHGGKAFQICGIRN